jgi:DNA-binding MarR family transcriptional regulator
MAPHAVSKKRNEGSTSLKTNLAEVALISVIRAGDALSKSVDDFYRKMGLTGAQYNVLRILEGAGIPLPQQMIARRLLVSRANVTGLLDKLEAKGLIERLSCEDRRVKMIRLTSEGFRLIEDTFNEVLERCSNLVGTLTKDEQRHLVRLLDKLEIKGG